MDRLYLMSVGAQIDLIDRYCFNCGAIIAGQIRFSDGMFACCRKANCEHEADRVDIGETRMSTGKNEHIIIRKLREKA